MKWTLEAMHFRRGGVLAREMSGVVAARGVVVTRVLPTQTYMMCNGYNSHNYCIRK